MNDLNMTQSQAMLKSLESEVKSLWDELKYLDGVANAARRKWSDADQRLKAERDRLKIEFEVQRRLAEQAKT